MKYKGFQEIVYGIELKPILWRERKDTKENITQAPTLKEKAKHEIKLVDQKQRNNKASQLLVIMCAEKPAEYIEDEVNAYSMWVKLEKLYSDSGFTARHTLLQKLMTTTLTSCNNSIKDYTFHIRRCAKDLKNIDAELSKWILVSNILNNLDGNFKDFVHRTVIALQTEPDVDLLITALLEEERLSQREESQSAFSAQLQKFKKSQESPDNKKPPICKHCKPGFKGIKKRHWEENCWTKHPEKRPQNSGNQTSDKQEANIAKRDDSSETSDTERSAHPNEQPAKQKQYSALAKAQIEDFDWESTDFSSDIRVNIALSQIDDFDDSQYDSIDDFVNFDDSEWDFCENIKNSQNLTQENSQILQNPQQISNITDVDMDPAVLIDIKVCIATPKHSAVRSTDWVIDSRCTHHIFHNREEFSNYTQIRSGITLANGTEVHTYRRGIVMIETLLEHGDTYILKVENILHVPDFTSGLLSISQLTSKGFKIHFFKNECVILKENKPVASAPKSNH